MTGKELERRLRKLARRRGLVFRFDEKRGKGSHGTFHLGNRRTTVKDRKKEIGDGLLSKMLDELGLTRDDS